MFSAVITPSYITFSFHVQNLGFITVSPAIITPPLYNCCMSHRTLETCNHSLLYNLFISHPKNGLRYSFSRRNHSLLYNCCMSHRTMRGIVGWCCFLLSAYISDVLCKTTPSEAVSEWSSPTPPQRPPLRTRFYSFSCPYPLDGCINSEPSPRIARPCLAKYFKHSATHTKFLRFAAFSFACALDSSSATSLVASTAAL